MIGLGFGNLASSSEGFNIGGIKFDGVNDYINVSSLAFAGDFAFQFWLEYVEHNAIWSIICGSYSNGIAIKLDGLSNYVNWPSTSFNLNTDPKTINKYHFIVTRSGSTITFYQDGVLADTKTYEGTVTLSRLGGTTLNANFGAYASKMAEVAAWNTFLTSGEITSLYNNNKGRLASTIKSGNLQRYYRLNGIAGDSIAIDETGNNNANLVNFDTATCWQQLT